jgi:hypothetical protein
VKVVGPTPAYRVENLEGLVASALSNGLAEMGATLEGAEYASLFNDSLLLAWELTGLDAAGELRFVHVVEAVGWGRDGELVPFALGPFTREEAAGHAAAALRARPNVLTVTVKRQRPKGAYDPTAVSRDRSARWSQVGWSQGDWWPADCHGWCPQLVPAWRATTPPPALPA